MFEFGQMWKCSDRTWSFKKITVTVIWGDGEGTGPYELQ